MVIKGSIQEEDFTLVNIYTSSKSSYKREVYNNTILPQETRKTSNRQSYFTPKTTGKRRTKRKHPTLCDPIDGSPPGSPVPGILQARVLEWGAIVFSATPSYFFLFFDYSTQHVGSQFPIQGLNPHSLQWKCKALTTGPPGNPHSFVFLMS